MKEGEEIEGGSEFSAFLFHSFPPLGGGWIVKKDDVILNGPINILLLLLLNRNKREAQEFICHCLFAENTFNRWVLIKIIYSLYRSPSFPSPVQINLFNFG